jgi:hypothetical protein
VLADVAAAGEVADAAVEEVILLDVGGKSWYAKAGTLLRSLVCSRIFAVW